MCAATDDKVDTYGIGVSCFFFPTYSRRAVKRPSVAINPGRVHILTVQSRTTVVSSGAMWAESWENVLEEEARVCSEAVLIIRWYM